MYQVLRVKCIDKIKYRTLTFYGILISKYYFNLSFSNTCLNSVSLAITTEVSVDFLSYWY